jgi:hypothetical protein
MPTDHIIALLIAERDKLNAAIEALQGRSAPKKLAAVETNVAAPVAPKKRHVSAAARKKMAAAQRSAGPQSRAGSRLSASYSVPTVPRILHLLRTDNR